MRIAVRIMKSVALVLLVSFTIFAQSNEPVTIVYDVKAREFKCWYEGDRLANPCNDNKNSHTFYQGVHIYRGQSVYLQYDGAHIIDLFSIGLTVNDLVEPAIPIFGSISELPSIKSIGPAESVVRGPGITLVATPNTLLFDLVGVLDKLAANEFKNLIKTALLDIVATDEAVKALTYARSGVIQRLDQVAVNTAPIPMQATAISMNVTSLMDEDNRKQQLGWLRNQYCLPSPTTSVNPENDFPIFNRRLLELSQIISKQNALKKQPLGIWATEHTPPALFPGVFWVSFTSTIGSRAMRLLLQVQNQMTWLVS